MDHHHFSTSHGRLGFQHQLTLCLSIPLALLNLIDARLLAGLLPSEHTGRTSASTGLFSGESVRVYILGVSQGGAGKCINVVLPEASRSLGTVVTSGSVKGLPFTLNRRSASGHEHFLQFRKSQRPLGDIRCREPNRGIPRFIGTLAPLQWSSTSLIAHRGVNLGC